MAITPEQYNKLMSGGKASAYNLRDKLKQQKMDGTFGKQPVPISDITYQQKPTKMPKTNHPDISPVVQPVAPKQPNFGVSANPLQPSVGPAAKPNLPDTSVQPDSPISALRNIQETQNKMKADNSGLKKSEPPKEEKAETQPLTYTDDSPEEYKAVVDSVNNVNTCQTNYDNAVNQAEEWGGRIEEIVKTFGATKDASGVYVFQDEVGLNLYNNAVKMYASAADNVFTTSQQLVDAKTQCAKDFDAFKQSDFYQKTTKYKNEYDNGASPISLQKEADSFWDKAQYNDYKYGKDGQLAAEIEDAETYCKARIEELDQQYAVDYDSESYWSQRYALEAERDEKIEAAKARAAERAEANNKEFSEMEERLGYLWLFYIQDIQSREDFASVSSKPSEDAKSALFESDGAVDLGVAVPTVTGGGKVRTDQAFGESKSVSEENYAQQIATYYYIYDTEGEDAANTYLNYILPAIRQANGQELAEAVNYPVLRQMVAFAAGAESGFTGLVNFFLDKPMLDSSLQYATKYAMADLAGGNWWDRSVASWTMGAAQSAGNMVPGMIAGLINPNLGLAVFGVSSAGSAYKEYMDAGLNKNDARAGGIMRGLAEVLTQKLLGGLSIPGFSGIFTGKAAEVIGSKMGSALGKVAVEIGVDTLSEIIEENAQNYIEPLINLSIGAADTYELPGWDDFLNTTMSTLFMTLAMNGAGAPGQVNSMQQNMDFTKNTVTPWLDAILESEKNGDMFAGADQIAYAKALQARIAKGEVIDSVEFQDQLWKAIKTDYYQFGGEARLATPQEQAEWRAGEIEVANPDSAVIHSAGTQAYINTGVFELKMAQAAGEVLDGITNGNVTSDNMSNKQADALQLTTTAGAKVVSDALGIEVPKAKTKSEARATAKSIAAQYGQKAAAKTAEMKRDYNARNVLAYPQQQATIPQATQHQATQPAAIPSAPAENAVATKETAPQRVIPTKSEAVAMENKLATEAKETAPVRQPTVIPPKAAAVSESFNAPVVAAPEAKPASVLPYKQFKQRFESDKEFRVRYADTASNRLSKEKQAIDAYEKYKAAQNSAFGGTEMSRDEFEAQYRKTHDTKKNAATAEEVEAAYQKYSVTTQQNIDNAEDKRYTSSKKNDAIGGERNGTGQESELGREAGTGFRGPDKQERNSRTNRGRGNGPEEAVRMADVVPLTSKSLETLKQRGVEFVEVGDISANSAAFCNALDVAREEDTENGWCVTPKTIDDLEEAGAKCYMEPHGSFGFAIAKNGDLEAVFKNKKIAEGLKQSHILDSLIPQALRLGATKLDCYGSGLALIYSKYGFIPVCKVEFNEKYANPGWNESKGRPYIFGMIHNGDSVETVVSNMGKYKDVKVETLRSLPLYDKESYDDAMQYRDELLEKQQQEKPSGLVRNEYSNAVPEQDAEGMDALGRLLGKRFVMGDLGDTNGRWHRNGDIDIDVAPEHRNAKSVFLFTAAHEIGHEIKFRIGKNAWNSLERCAIQIKGDKAVSDKRKSDKEYSDVAAARADVACDFIGELLSEKETLDLFLQSIKDGKQSENVTGIRAFLTAAKSFFGKLTGKGDATTEALAAKVQEVFGADIATAQKAVAELQKAVAAATKENKNAAKDGDAKSSKKPTPIPSKAQVLAQQAERQSKSSKKNYNIPLFSDKQWGILNAARDRQVFDESHFLGIDSWVYIDTKGEKLFAIYSREVPSDPTMIYWGDGKQAEKMFNRLNDFLEGETYDGSRESLAFILGLQTVPKANFSKSTSGVGQRGQSNRNGEVSSSKRQSDGHGADSGSGQNRKRGIGNDSDTKSSKKDGSGNTPSSTGDRVVDLSRQILRPKVDEYGAMPKGESPSRVIAVPTRITDDTKVSKVARNAMEAGVTPDGMLTVIVDDVIEGGFNRSEKKNKELVANAKAWMNRKVDVNDAYTEWMRDNKGKIGADAIARGWVIYNNMVTASENVTSSTERDALQKRAILLLGDIARTGTVAGQTVQAFRILKQLSPEMRYYDLTKSVNRLEDRINESHRHERMESRSSSLEQQAKAARDRADALAADAGASKEAIAKAEQKAEKAEAKAKEAAKKAGEFRIEIDKDLAARWMQALREGDEDLASDLEKVLFQQIATQIPKTVRDYLDAWRYLAMLGQAKTWLRNAKGNAFFAPFFILKDKIGAVIEALTPEEYMPKSQRTKYGGVLRATQRGRDLLAYASEDMADFNVQHLLESNKYDDADANNRLSEAIKEEHRKLGFKNKDGVVGVNLRDENGKIDLWNLVRDMDGRNAFVKGFKGVTTATLRGWQQLTSYMMEKCPFMGDQFYKSIHYRRAFAGMAMARGYTAADFKNGKVSQEELLQIRTYATSQALKATFNDVNAISNFFKKHCNENGQFRKTAIVANTAVSGAMPFRGVPANVFVRAFEFSPLGLIKAATADLQILKNGKLSTQEYIERISSGVTGTTALGIGILLSALGAIRLNVDDDDELQGKQRYSLEIFGKSISLSWLAPTSIPIFMGAELYHICNDEDAEISWQYVIDTFGNLMNPILDMSMLDGAKGMLENISYALAGKNDFSAGDVFASLFMDPMFSYLGQFVPTVSNQLANATEENRTTTYVGDISKAADRQFIRNLAKITEKIPGVNWWQIDYVDNWGRKQSNGNGWTRFYNSFLNTSHVNDIVTTDADIEFEMLDEQTGESVAPTKRKSVIKVPDGVDEAGNPKSKEIRLNGDQYEAYQTKYGQTYAVLASELMASEYYDTLTPSEKVKAFDDIESLADELGKKAALGDEYVMLPGDDDRILVKFCESGVDPIEAYGLHILSEQLDNNESIDSETKNAQLIDKINSYDSWNAEQKAAAFRYAMDFNAPTIGDVEPSDEQKEQFKSDYSMLAVTTFADVAASDVYKEADEATRAAMMADAKDLVYFYAKRNYATENELSDDNYDPTTASNKYDTLMNADLTFEQAYLIKQKFNEISDDKKYEQPAKADGYIGTDKSAQANDFKTWVDTQKDFTPAQKAAIKDTYKFYRMQEVETERYDELTTKYKLSPGKAATVSKALSGKKTNIEKYTAVNKTAGLSESDKWNVILSLNDTDDASAAKIKIVKDAGVPVKTYISYLENRPKNKNGDYTKWTKRTLAPWLNEQVRTGRLTKAQANALWKATDSKWGSLY